MNVQGALLEKRWPKTTGPVARRRCLSAVNFFEFWQRNFKLTANFVSNARSNPAAGISATHEREIVGLLCVLAAIHVFVFSAAFPFFNNVDEQAHFDLVIKYSQGHIPLGLEPFSAESVPYLAICGSPEYFNDPAALTGGQFPPPLWMEPPTEKHLQRLLALETRWRAHMNHESSQPPLYYALAGLWWHLGQWCGFKGGRLLYWLRFLNILVVAATVWLGYRAARMIFPEQCFPRMAVPALLAFMPQTAFYLLGNDVLSPFSFGVLFICAARWMCVEVPNIQLGIVSGLAFAATLLTKWTNLPLLVVAGAVVLFKIWRLFGIGRLRASWPAPAAMALCAGLPVAAWLAWCKYNYGDFTGAKIKIERLGWTRKPFGEWFGHPLFTPHGLWTYLSGQLATFWQGELWWHGRPLAWPTVDVIYTIASLFLLALALAGVFQWFANATQLQRRAICFSFTGFVVSLASFAFLSVIYDFHNCPNPSREHPYFTAGRMMLGTLIPFLLLFVYGLDHAFSFTKKLWPRWLTFAGMVWFMLVSEIATDWPVFFSKHNRFHM
jgi:hypothetical protein